MSGTPPVVLSVSGSDSGGGAGAQADLKTYGALGVHGATAITALTAQNTVGVAGVLPTPAAFLALQITTVLDDLDVVATKTGMLATPENGGVVADLADAGRLGLLVVDPVVVDSSGRAIVADALVDLYRKRLVSRADVLTPNTHEAAVLLGWPRDRVAGVAGQRDAARALGDLGATHVVVKGGRVAGDCAVDVLWGPDGLRELSSPWVVTDNNHGTGCSFAAAVAAFLARGLSGPDAVDAAKAFVTRAMQGAAGWRLGRGRGGIDHFGR